MHTIKAVPTARIRGEDRTDHGAVHPIIFRAATDFRADSRERWTKTHPFELPQAVRIDEHARTDFAKRRRLFEDRNPKAAPQEGVRCGEAADASANNRGVKTVCAHVSLRFTIRWSCRPWKR